MANNSGGANKKPNQTPITKPVAKANVPPLTNPVLRSSQSLRKDVIVKAPAAFIFGKKNYQFMLLGIGFLIIGFYLMSGTTDIMSTTKIVIAPIIVLMGFAIEFYAILTKPAKAV